MRAAEALRTGIGSTSIGRGLTTVRPHYNYRRYLSDQDFLSHEVNNGNRMRAAAHIARLTPIPSACRPRVPAARECQ